MMFVFFVVGFIIGTITTLICYILVLVSSKTDYINTKEVRKDSGYYEAIANEDSEEM